MLSIIIINYNTFQMTCECIESIYKHTKDIDFEIILVDNASKECDANLFKEKFEEIHLVKSSTNIGFAKGNNLGISHAKGDYILLLNSDTVLIDNSIQQCLGILENNAKIGAITPKLIFENGTIQYNAQPLPSVLKKLIELFRIHKIFTKGFRSQFMQGFYWDYDCSGTPDWIWGTFFMFPKKILMLLPDKKLNEDYFMYMEDMKWSFDIWKLGLKLYYNSATSVIHKMSQSAFDKKNVTLHTNYNHFLKNNYSILSCLILKR